MNDVDPEIVLSNMCSKIKCVLNVSKESLSLLHNRISQDDQSTLVFGYARHMESVCIRRGDN